MRCTEGGFHILSDVPPETSGGGLPVTFRASTSRSHGEGDVTVRRSDVNERVVESGLPPGLPDGADACVSAARPQAHAAALGGVQHSAAGPLCGVCCTFRHPGSAVTDPSGGG